MIPPEINTHICADFVEALLGKLLLMRKGGKPYTTVATELLGSGIVLSAGAAEAKEAEDEQPQKSG